jgi:hypothetical protein
MYAAPVITGDGIGNGGEIERLLHQAPDYTIF